MGFADEGPKAKFPQPGGPAALGPRRSAHLEESTGPAARRCSPVVLRHRLAAYSRIGSVRTGRPVAANTALQTAGARGETPGSPTPPGAAPSLRRSRRVTIAQRGTSGLLAGRARGAKNRLAYPTAGAAPAEHPIHGRFDLLAGRPCVLGEQRRGRHQLAGLTVAALGHLLYDPGPLQRGCDL